MKYIHIHIGYWKNDNDAFPIPVANSWENVDSNFISWLESYLNDWENIKYRGISICRICGCCNDCSEYNLDVEIEDNTTLCFHIPSGYLHYLKDHRVRPFFEVFELLKNKKYKEILQLENCVEFDRDKFVIDY